MRAAWIVMQSKKRPGGWNGTHAARFAGLGLVLLLAAAGLGGPPPVRKPVPEATVFDAVDGVVTHADANDSWFFELTADVNSADVQAPAGTRLLLLPSAALERLIADVNDRYAPRYRLSARVTLYGGTNYLFPTYFLPLSKLKDEGGAADGAADSQAAVPEPKADDAGLTIPAEVLEKLKEHRPTGGPRRTGPRGDSPPAGRDGRSLGYLVVDRVGSFEREGSHLVFVPNALGWKVGGARYELLPCGVLEQAEHAQATALEPLRFNVAGLVTRFQGQEYLLLQRATAVYNYGNFGR